VTCPLILETLARDLRAVGASGRIALPALPEIWGAGGAAAGGAKAWVADQNLQGQALVLEAQIFPAGEVVFDRAAAQVAQACAGLVPTDEKETRERLAKGLVVIPDADFAALMDTVVPVQARIKLTARKSTGTDRGSNETGNLWYEEVLPSDCLFVALVGERRGKGNGAGLRDLTGVAAERFAVMQIGGNETVGQGLCVCTLLSQATQETAA